MGQRVKSLWMAVLVVGLLTAGARAQDEAAVLKTQKDKVSYAVGADIARSFKKQGVDINLDLFIKGLKDELSGEKLLMTGKDLQAALNEFQTELKQKRARAIKDVAEDNKRKGGAFLSANKGEERVVTLPSGLQYKILKEGNGARPTEADTVEVQYRGTLIDGTEFDSSYHREQPATFKVTGVIPGWKEALQLMPVGSKWQLFVPPELAYGEKGHAYRTRGSGNIIGPNETLIFEIELLAIK